MQRLAFTIHTDPVPYLLSFDRGIQRCFLSSVVLQIGEEMSQNSFIQQYLAKQQELLRQRLEREAQQKEDADGTTGT